MVYILCDIVRTQTCFMCDPSETPIGCADSDWLSSNSKNAKDWVILDEHSIGDLRHNDELQVCFA